MKILSNVCLKKNVANKSIWKQNVNKKKRMEGEQYLGISKKVHCQKLSRQLREASSVKCNDVFCQKVHKITTLGGTKMTFQFKSKTKSERIFIEIIK